MKDQRHPLVVVEDTPALHNVIVCTQCSWTAWSVLGLPPDWYKPAGTEGWSEERLASIVRCEAMIGVALVDPG